ncbi:MAG: sigma-54-dependent Fis family transcriptional regulator [Acidobacteria bacterium]|nr:sigma-54-dependent Fis family transcriptional regulator [Acidobacteriota bacterium]
MEIEIKDGPRDPQQRIFLFHDSTEIYNLRRQLDERALFRDLVGKSEAMQLVFQRIRLLAIVDSTVLIEGATGTGKELVARAIHDHSHRQGKPFIAVNLAGLTLSLLNSLLFGHKRGAFTGAVADQTGFFEAADGGTIFLDEIGDVPPDVQTALLRVIQEKEIVRLGETKPRKVNVRVLAATQHDPNNAVEDGRLRVDLLYRIRVGRVVLPLLRDRRGDIPLLINHFLGLCSAATGKAVQEISHEAMRIMIDYPWPGNVRELKSAVEFAVIQARGSVIREQDLPPEVLGLIPRPPSSLGQKEDEAQRILAAINRAKGNRTVAAALLGISRATLYRRLAQMDRDTDKTRSQ